MGCTPIEILFVWEGKFGRLEDRQRKSFLKNKLVLRLTNYEIDRVQDAVLAGEITLKAIQKYVEERAHLIYETELKTRITSVGAYLLGKVIYSIRRDRRTNEWQVWEYSSEEKEYVRVDNSSRETLILNKISPNRRLTREMAIEYSIETGICCHCGRRLSALKSVSTGMGPHCAKLYH